MDYVGLCVVILCFVWALEGSLWVLGGFCVGYLMLFGFLCGLCWVLCWLFVRSLWVIVGALWVIWGIT